ncbi:MAG TPA: hypothetical protein VF815_00670 [Myxococcaceae bacterium]|jgi:hypothetical protein
MAEPTPDARTLMELFPPSLAEKGSLPLAFALSHAKQTPVAKMRWDESEVYRARIFNCLPAWKPVTRCFAEEGE